MFTRRGYFFGDSRRAGGARSCAGNSAPGSRSSGEPGTPHDEARTSPGCVRFDSGWWRRFAECRPRRRRAPNGGSAVRRRSSRRSSSRSRAGRREAVLRNQQQVRGPRGWLQEHRDAYSVFGGIRAFADGEPRAVRLASATARSRRERTDMSIRSNRMRALFIMLAAAAALHEAVPSHARDSGRDDHLEPADIEVYADPRHARLCLCGDLLRESALWPSMGAPEARFRLPRPLALAHGERDSGGHQRAGYCGDGRTVRPSSSCPARTTRRGR